MCVLRDVNALCFYILAETWSGRNVMETVDRY
jgi:hypothetical protein